MTLGFVVWGVLIGLILAYEGIGLVSTTDRWPSFSHVTRTVTQTSGGRWILFGMWLWIGWHLFAKGWRTFFGG